MLIHAFRRKAAVTHTIGSIAYKFTPNEHGHVVCEVDDSHAEQFFLKTPQAFKVFGDEPAKPAPAQGPADGSEPSKFILVNGETRVDLGAMTDDEVKAFAKANGLEVDLRARGDKLRQAVHEAAVKANDEEA